jgi:hypothetical protein
MVTASAGMDMESALDSMLKELFYPTTSQEAETIESDKEVELARDIITVP